MTWKTGDTVSIPLRLETLAGLALSYASLAAFNADGWAIVFRQAGAALASPPTVALTADPTIAGLHYATFLLPAGVDTMAITGPVTYRVDNSAWLLITPNNDEDAISAQLASAAATPVAVARLNQYDWTVTEGDSFLKGMSWPSASLSDFGYADFSSLTWSLTGAVRSLTDTSTSTPAAVLKAEIVSTTLLTITAGWGGAFPAGLAMQAADILAGSKSWRYDIQARATQTFSVTGVSTGSKTFTISGDQRKFFDEGSTFTVTGSTGNDATYTIAALGVQLVGGNTVLTVTTTPASAVADGSVNVVITLTGIFGTITVRYQVDRT